MPFPERIILKPLVRKSDQVLVGWLSFVSDENGVIGIDDMDYLGATSNEVGDSVAALIAEVNAGSDMIRITAVPKTADPVSEEEASQV